MIKTIIMSLNIEKTYAINSFLYNLKRLPIFKDLLTDDVYQSQKIKSIFKFLSNFYYIIKIIIYRLFYFALIYFLAHYLGSNLSKSFIHIYFTFTILGLFINNKLLNTSIQKYLSIILLKIDAKNYMKSSLFFDLIRSLILNTISFLIFKPLLHISFKICIFLILLSFLSRIIGEALNLLYYHKYNYIWLNNYPLYFSLLSIFVILTILPYFKIYFSNTLIILTCLLFIILVPFCLLYLLKVDDYKLIYKKLNTQNVIMNTEEAKSYSRQQMVEVKRKDIVINPRKLKNKKGYELFNTIFFERNKEILLRSTKRYSLIAFLIYLFIIILIINNKHIYNIAHSFLLNNLGWFIIIMYFINRGSIITQAMFFNCDHAMLTYNFYKEPKVILNLFKKRTISVVKANLLPAILIGIGNIIILYLTKEYNVTMYLMMFLFIISLSIFFSIHYLVIYYLLQPYDKTMKMKKASYSIVSLLTYLICYFLATSVSLNIYFYSLLGIIFSLLYIIIALILVYLFSPKTFKLN